MIHFEVEPMGVCLFMLSCSIRADVYFVKWKRQDICGFGLCLSYPYQTWLFNSKFILCIQLAFAFSFSFVWWAADSEPPAANPTAPNCSLVFCCLPGEGAVEIQADVQLGRQIAWRIRRRWRIPSSWQLGKPLVESTHHPPWETFVGSLAKNNQSFIFLTG